MKEAAPSTSNPGAGAKQLDAKVKQAVPEGKKAEQLITKGGPEAAKKADSKVKVAVPQAKQAENVATGKSGGFSFDLGGIFGGNTAETAQKADSKVQSCTLLARTYGPSLTGWAGPVQRLV